jgi:hypothetical protein
MSVRFAVPFSPAGGFVSPPTHAGMDPSLLPAFSAPNGVNVLPSLATSSAEAAAHDVFAPTDIAKKLAINAYFPAM